jgi:hypothetical protein
VDCQLVEVGFLYQVLVHEAGSLHVLSQRDAAMLGVSVVPLREVDVGDERVEVVHCERDHIEVLLMILLVAYEQLDLSVVVLAQVLEELEDLLLYIDHLVVNLRDLLLTHFQILVILLPDAAGQQLRLVLHGGLLPEYHIAFLWLSI